ncbi:MAG: D-tyrosyl-tRNA(Tyr) deacylase [Erysipelotrichaceae bacterium]|nr:D-tyrosyl-tRNA(Tyr) deacylase [Erysipelotrichaceae bacterium]
MRAVVQRVTKSSVAVDGRTTGAIGKGLMVLLGVKKGDTAKDVEYISRKISALRVFDDEKGVMNKSIKEAGGDILIVSQFTLLGDVRKGNRPSYFDAAGPEEANALYREVIARLQAEGLRVEEGVFQAEMALDISNDGPVTILLDSERSF